MKPEKDIMDRKLKEAERIAYLIAGFLQKTLTEEEHDELDAWVVASDENMKLFEELTDPDHLEAGIAWQNRINSEKALQQLKEDIGLKRKYLFRKILPYLAAAVLLIIAGIYFIKNQYRNEDEGRSNAMAETKSMHKQAVLTLSNGRTIILDSASKGLLAEEGAVDIEYGEEGEIVYKGMDDILRYNQISTPRGGQFHVVLGDGTVVWLNAESSIKFSASFAKNREVELRGEAYFDVVPKKSGDKSLPFTVKFHDVKGEEVRVEVLGTRFNVKSYADEGSVNTTLTEGRITVHYRTEKKEVRPGEKAEIDNGIHLSSADIDKETGWMRGLFVFRNATIENIGAELSRWYDIEVIKEGPVDYHFNATINRNESLEDVLNVLESTRRIKFRTEGKKIFVRP